jgi:hypothetical protein
VVIANAGYIKSAAFSFVAANKDIKSSAVTTLLWFADALPTKSDVSDSLLNPLATNWPTSYGVIPFALSAAGSEAMVPAFSEFTAFWIPPAAVADVIMSVNAIR